MHTLFIAEPKKYANFGTKYGILLLVSVVCWAEISFFRLRYSKIQELTKDEMREYENISANYQSTHNYPRSIQGSFVRLNHNMKTCGHKQNHICYVLSQVLLCLSQPLIFDLAKAAMFVLASTCLFDQISIPYLFINLFTGNVSHFSLY